MLHGLRRALLSCLMCSVVLAACGDDKKPTDDGVAGTTAFPGTPCGSTGMLFCKVNEVCMGEGPTAVCMVTETPCTLDTECNGGKCCAGKCVSTTTDSANCGACGTTCTSPQSCVASACTAPTCKPPAQSSSDDDAGTGSTSTKTYGANGCPANETCGAGAVCMCGTGSSCPDGESCSATGTCGCGSSGAACTLGQACCGESCVDVLTNVSNCGACGKACALDETCSNGVCGCVTSGEVSCDGECVNKLTDADHCGACDTACATGATCTAGKCECPAGQIACGGACVDASEDTHCGACDTTCEGDTACGERLDGSNKFECLCPNFNFISCDGVCVDPRTRENCGECGEVCPAATLCKADPSNTWLRSCECSTATNTYCAGSNACVNMQVDEENCGACGIDCLVGETCTAGVCSCSTSGELFCEVAQDEYDCIAATDENNCYGCGEKCLGNTMCDGTAQGCICLDSANKPDANKKYCDDKCVEFKTDELHCGGCGIECPSGSTCTAGKCSCPSAQLWCVDGDEFGCEVVATDVDNCGACGTECATGQNCCAGDCTTPGTQENDTNCGPCGEDCTTMTGCGFLGFGDKSCNLGVCNCN